MHGSAACQQNCADRCPRLSGCAGFASVLFVIGEDQDVPAGRCVLYHIPVHHLAERVKDCIQRQALLKPGDRVGVAVSAGADSVALFHLLLELRDELGIVLSVVHFNHRLRGAESDSDEEFVRDLAASHCLDFRSKSADVAAHASDKKLSVEAAARKLRYEFFRGILDSAAQQGLGLNKIATGHTLDDQAETVLLRIMRGTGIRGLSGIHPSIKISLPGKREAAIIRPLLQTRRTALKEFLLDLGQSWREDSSNQDPAFSRNRLRQELLPLMERKFNPEVVEALAELAEIARAEEDDWQDSHPEVLAMIRNAQPEHVGGHPLDPVNAHPEIDLIPFRSLSLAAQRRLLRAIAEVHLGAPMLSFRQVESLRELALGEPGKTRELQGGYVVRRTRDTLRFEQPLHRLRPCDRDYEYILPVPGRVEVPEISSAFEASLLPSADLTSGYNPELLLDPTFTGLQLSVRNWRAGDRYWPAHTKASKKVNELLSDRRLSGPERSSWPVVVAPGAGLIWMRGFPTQTQSQPLPGSQHVVLIRESPLNTTPLNTDETGSKAKLLEK